MTTKITASLVGIAAMLASVTAGCMVGTATEDTGSIDMSLQLGPSVAINSVDWTISNAASGFSRTSTVNVRTSNMIQFQAGAIPSGDGYTIALTASSVDGAFTCSGSANFAVSTGAITPINLIFNCSSAPSGTGGVVVTGTTQVCANLDALGVSPLQTAVYAPISLSATASAGSVPAIYAWTATAGTFDDPQSATPTFSCPSTPGPVTISVSVSPSAPECPTVTTQSVTVQCTELEPTFTNVYASILVPRCNGCHKPGGSGVNGGLLDTSTQAAAFANLVGVAAQGTSAGSSGVTCASTSLVRVIPNDAANSLLFTKAHSKSLGTSPPCGSPMPPSPTSAPLSQGELDLIAAWINAGAYNN
ncbi:MAG: hypothetical protein AB7P03_10870 [Kofleriaceae bacterium]